jgi:DNA-directed RNA polymerase subunit M/transcription elongation factor TFIIS
MKADNMARRRKELALEGRCTECGNHLSPEEAKRNQGLKVRACEACRLKRRAWQQDAGARKKHGWIPIHRAWHRRSSTTPRKAYRGRWVSAKTLVPWKDVRGRVYFTEAKIHDQL